MSNTPRRTPTPPTPAAAITPVVATALLRDLVHARHDLVTLAQTHGLDETALARWAHRSSVRRTLADLCTLADFQTQLLLSQYRRVAATRLVQLAGGEDGASHEQSRRACVDLLKIDLPRTAGENHAPATVADASASLSADELRRWLYGPDSDADAPAGPDESTPARTLD